MAAEIFSMSLTDSDLVVDGDGSLEWLAGADAVKQMVLVRLRLFYGEWVGDREAGVPYYQEIFDTSPLPDGTHRPPSRRLIEAAIRKVILGTPRVENISTFALEINAQTRVLSVDFSCSTSEGVVDISEVFGP